MNFKSAIHALSFEGLPVKETSYGFSLILEDEHMAHSAECGMEHDGSISLSVKTPNAPQRREFVGLKPGDNYISLEWFFHPTPLEMTKHLLAAHKLVQTNVRWIDALRATATLGE